MGIFFYPLYESCPQSYPWSPDRTQKCHAKRYHRARWTDRKTPHHVLCWRTCTSWGCPMTRKDQNHPRACKSPWTRYKTRIIYAWSPPIWPHRKWDLSHGKRGFLGTKRSYIYQHPPRRWNQPYSPKSPIRASRSDGRKKSHHSR